MYVKPLQTRTSLPVEPKSKLKKKVVTSKQSSKDKGEEPKQEERSNQLLDVIV